MNTPWIVQVDPDLLEIIPGYLANRQQDVQALQEALLVKDWETMRVLGHRMKGSGAGYGFEAITEIGRGLEEAARTMNADSIAVQVQHLAEFLDKVQVVSE